jgi:prepilin signal peptidase PulO-like enzyme (type II secretory pathway)
MSYLILVLFTLIALGAASIADFKTREVPDYISYILIGGGLLLRLVYALEINDYSGLIWLPIAFVILCLFAYFMYRAGQWGGGDVKIMAGLALIMSYKLSNMFFPFFIDFFVNMLFAGTVYGIIMMVLRGLKKIDTVKKELSWIDIALVSVFLIAVVVTVIFLHPWASLMVLALFSLFGAFSIRYMRLVEKKLMIDDVDVVKLTEGDWITDGVKLKGKTIVPVRKIGVTLEDLDVIKKNYKSLLNKTVPVKVGIPFVPAFFIAYLFTLLWGNIIYQILVL